MKQNLSGFLTLFLLFLNVVSLNSEWRSNFTTKKDVMQFENYLNINTEIRKNLLYNQTVHTTLERDDAFNRSSSQTIQNYSLGYKRSNRIHSILLTSTRSLDTASPGETDYYYKRTDNELGYRFSLSENSKFNLVSEAKFSNMDNTIRQVEEKNADSEGYSLSNKLLYNYLDEVNKIDFSLTHQYSSRKYDPLYDFINMRLDWSSTDTKFNTITSLSYENASKDIYHSFVQTDTHEKREIGVINNSDIFFSDNLFVNLQCNLYSLNNNFSENQLKSYEVGSGDFLVDLETSLYLFHFNWGFDFERYVKTFEIEENSYDQNLYSLYNKTVFSPSNGDSLIFTGKTDFQKTSTPSPDNQTDNDQISNSIELTYIGQFGKRFRFRNRLLYYLNEQVYISSVMSGNNKVRNSYNLLPDINIHLGHGFYFYQYYHLMADYDDFVWDEFNQDRLFRRLTAAYQLAYDPGRSFFTTYTYTPDSPVFVSFLYEYLMKDSGEMNGNIYTKFNESEIHKFCFDMKLNIDKITFTSKTTYFQSNLKELDEKMSIIYEFSDQSFLAVNINPNKASLEKFYWKVGVELLMNF